MDQGGACVALSAHFLAHMITGHSPQETLFKLRLNETLRRANNFQNRIIQLASTFDQNDSENEVKINRELASKLFNIQVEELLAEDDISSLSLVIQAQLENNSTGLMVKYFHGDGYVFHNVAIARRGAEAIYFDPNVGACAYNINSDADLDLIYQNIKGNMS